MRRWSRTTACERAAQWVSLDLDGELSDLEGAALSRHLERCAPCSALRAEIAAFTLEIRATPAAPPPAAVQVLTPHASRGLLARRVVIATTACAALAASLAAVFLPGAPAIPSSEALASLSAAQFSRFVHAEHVRIEPQAFTTQSAQSRPSSFAAPVLF